MADELQAGRAFVDLIPRLSPAASAAGQAQVGGMLAGIKAKAAVAGVGIAGALAAPLSGLALFKLGEAFNEQYRTIRIGTGATGAALEGLNQSFRNVAKGSAAPFSQVATAIADLNTRTGLTGKSLETLATAQVKLARLTKADLEPQIAATTRLFGDWSVATEDQVSTLDSLFKVSQSTGIGVGTLSEKLVKFGAPLRQLGFSMEESAALLGKFEKEGVNSDLVMGSMRIALGKLARAGEPAQETFRRVTQEIKDAGSASEANGLALELFGARAGPDMAAAIREGRFEVGALMDQIKSSPETIDSAAKATSTFSGKLSVLKNAVAVAFEPLATRVYQTVNRFATAALPHVISGVTAFAEVIGKVSDVLGDGLAIVGRWAGTVISAFQGLAGDDGVNNFAETMDYLLGNSGKYVDLFASIGSAILDAVGTIRRVVDDLQDRLSPLVDLVKDNLTPILASLGAVLGTLGLAAILGAIASAVGLVGSALLVLVGILTSPIALIVALGAAFVIAYQKVEGFRNIVDGVVRFLLETVVPKVAEFAGYVAATFADLVAWVEAHWASISEAADHAMNFVLEVVQRILDVVVGLWNAWGDNLLTILEAVWSQIQLTVKTALDLVRGVIEFVLAVINGEWGKAWDALFGIVKTILGYIIGTLQNIVPTIVSIFSAVMELAVRAVEIGLGKIVDFFVALPGRLARAAGNVFGFLWEAFKAAVNLIIRGWNALEFKIPGFDPPGPGPKFGGFTLGLPDVPLLELGGKVLREGLGIVGDKDGRGGEVVSLPRGASVVPLDVARMIADAALAGQDGSSLDVGIEVVDKTEKGIEVKMGRTMRDDAADHGRR